MKAHITTKCKPCPFCGARADEIESITGMDLIACSNYNGCGAIVSFNNKDCDERGVSPVVYFNRRTERRNGMTIGAAMLGAFLLLLLVGTITLAITGLVRLLVDRPVALFSIVFAVLFVLLTIWLYVEGNAV